MLTKGQRDIDVLIRPGVVMGAKSDDSGLDLKALVRRLEERMAARKTNATRVAIAAGLGKTAVHDILSGKNRSPSVPAIRRIARVLGTTSAYLTGEEDDPAGAASQHFATIPIIGIAETGAFRPMPQSAEEYEMPVIHGPRCLTCAAAKHFALEIRGDSMNAAKPMPLVAGMYALCVDMIDAELTIETGRIYAVRRTRDGGQTYEVTIKRAHVFKTRIELRPESTNPAHATITVPRGRDEAGAEEVVAFGWVYGVFGSMEL